MSESLWNIKYLSQSNGKNINNSPDFFDIRFRILSIFRKVPCFLFHIGFLIQQTQFAIFLSMGEQFPLELGVRAKVYALN
jgi:hypothetical protein